jgi:hypothetical protein
VRQVERRKVVSKERRTTFGWRVGDAELRVAQPTDGNRLTPKGCIHPRAVCGLVRHRQENRGSLRS